MSPSATAPHESLPAAGPSAPSTPDAPNGSSPDMKTRTPFSRSSEQSKSVATTTPQTSTVTVERSSWIGEPTYDGVDSSPEQTRTGETLGSLELGLEGDFGNNSTTSEGDSEPTDQTYFQTTPKKRKRNKLRQLVSTEAAHYDFDVVAGMLDARNTQLHKPSPLEISSAIVIEEGSSPKTILPGNALQLHLAEDDTAATTTPTTSFSSTSSPLAPQRPSDDQSTLPSEIMSLNDDTQTRPAARVHFRSRVRITSGLSSRRRQEGSVPIPSRSKSRDDLTATTASGSPSSSISVPLRYHPDENNVLGPLGKRLSSLAESRRKRLGNDLQTKRLVVGGDERTPFLRGTPVPDYTRQRRRTMSFGSNGSGGEEDEDIDSGLKREEEVLFGRWPWRAFNRHWWWYQCEFVLCCCSDDLDDE